MPAKRKPRPRAANEPAPPPPLPHFVKMAGDAGATITETEAGRDAAVFALEFLNAPDITQMQRGALVVLLTMIFHGETEEIRATALAALQAAANTSDRDPSRGPAMMVKIFRG